MSSNLNQIFASQNFLGEERYVFLFDTMVGRNLEKKIYDPPLAPKVYDPPLAILAVSTYNCQKSFCQQLKLKKHIQTVHEKLRPFKCEHCQRSFGDKGDLTRHVKIVHDEVRPFSCELCKKTFGTKRQLKPHIGTVHEQ